MASQAQRILFAEQMADQYESFLAASGRVLTADGIVQVGSRAETRAAYQTHGVVDGTHVHAHSSMGLTPTGTHSHEHQHQGDGSHDHHRGRPPGRPVGEAPPGAPELKRRILQNLKEMN